MAVSASTATIKNVIVGSGEQSVIGPPPDRFDHVGNDGCHWQRENRQDHNDLTVVTHPPLPPHDAASRRASNRNLVRASFCDPFCCISALNLTRVKLSR